MKLQTKLLTSVLVTIASIYLVAQVVQQIRSRAQMRGLAATNLRLEEESQWEVVQQLLGASSAALVDAMTEGEMDRFQKLIAAQRNVKGVIEFSLHDHKGRVVYSSDPARLKQGLPVDLQVAVLGSPTEQKRRTADAYEIYRPVAVEKSCLECHPAFKMGEVGGVFAYRFSTAGLVRSQKQWSDFVADLGGSLLWQALITSAVLLVVVSVVVTLVVQRQISRPLERVTAAIGTGAGEVDAAAGQLSSSSQSLAAGSSEQAASLEEASSSLEEMAGMTKRNAENAAKANLLASEARHAADASAGDLQAMGVAMREIKTSSDDIAKIIQTIDEIAFQTNILALNAAVEAARAGEAGMGFAVVADEVRNLAQRSAQAAKETAAKIEGAIGKTAQGVGISAKVAATLAEIVEKVRQVDTLVAEVASASRDQSSGVQQITTAVGQMDKVVQSDAAAAEESASAAEELNAQAAALQGAVGELRQMIHGDAGGTRAVAPAAGAISPAKKSSHTNLSVRRRHRETPGLAAAGADPRWESSGRA